MSAQLVVLIDDHVTNLKILERLAASLGEKIVARSFTDPHAALAFTAGTCPDLVVAGIETADLDAAALIGGLRAGPEGGEIPIIVVTAPDDRERRSRALAAGASDYLPTPVDPEEFRRRAGNLLELRRLRRIKARPAAGSARARDRSRQRTHEERLLRVIDAVPAMIAATDRDGRYLVVNDRFAGLFGLPPHRLIGKRPEEIRDDAFSRQLSESDARLFAGESLPESFEEEIADAAGAPRRLLTTKSLFGSGKGGKEAMVVTVSLDITERRNAERDMMIAKELAEIANRSKTEFLANMSHELRTPLNAIIGFSQVMAGEMLGPIATRKYVGYAQDVAASAEHLLGIINDILDVSKLEAGRLDLSEEPIDLARTVREVIRLVEQKARAGEVRLDLDFERELPHLRGDTRKIKQILLNLLTNAIKFSPTGSEVRLAARTEGGAMVIAVTDRGIGMDENEIEVAISRFGQVASAWSRKQPGTGLGLPLAIGLTELHGGHLAIESRKGVGTTVTLTFPRERSLYAPEASEPVALPVAFKAASGA